MLLSNPNVTASEYKRFSNELRNIERNTNSKEIAQVMAKSKIKKVSEVFKTYETFFIYT